MILGCYCRYLSLPALQLNAMRLGYKIITNAKLNSVWIILKQCQMHSEEHYLLENSIS